MSDHSTGRILGLGVTHCAPAGTPFLASLERPALIMLEEGESEIVVRGNCTFFPWRGILPCLAGTDKGTAIPCGIRRPSMD
jgi:hypothetical protein